MTLAPCSGSSESGICHWRGWPLQGMWALRNNRLPPPRTISELVRDLRAPCWAAEWFGRLEWGNLSLVFSLPSQESFKLTISGKFAVPLPQMVLPLTIPMQFLAKLSFHRMRWSHVHANSTMLAFSYREVIWIYGRFSSKNGKFRLLLPFSFMELLA